METKENVKTNGGGNGTAKLKSALISKPIFCTIGDGVAQIGVLRLDPETNKIDFRLNDQAVNAVFQERLERGGAPAPKIIVPNAMPMRPQR